jgi:tRNA(Arg) A34 adenosine deaminase TadA
MAAPPVDHLPPPWQVALRLAWEAHCAGNIGVGAVLTNPTGTIVARGRNRVCDATAPPGRLSATYLAHAEIDVLGQLPEGDYKHHTLWTTLEPCLLCLSAVVLSHVGTVRYAAADPLWHDLDGLPQLNAQVARRWPARIGPLSGPVAALCALLPLIWAVRRNSEGVVARAYGSSNLSLLALARRLADEGVPDDGSVECALQRWWEDLSIVAARS